MSHLDDYRLGGLWPLQDHSQPVEIAKRRAMAGIRVESRRGDLDRGEHPDRVQKDSAGDVIGGLLTREIEGRRDYLHAWWMTGCPVIAKPRAVGSQTTVSRDGAWLVMRAPGEADRRLLPLDLIEHPVLPDQIYPGRWTGVVSAGSEETSQTEVLHPDFLGLVAPHHGPPAAAGTPVFDPEEGELRPTRFARFQTLARVARVGGRLSGPTLAFQMGEARDNRIGGGLVADGPRASQILACLSVAHGGPIDVGDSADRHVVGITADAEPVKGAHLSTQSVFRGRGVWDCALEFQDVPYESPTPGPILIPVHLRVDPFSTHETALGTFPSLGRWEAETAVYYVPPRLPPPPFDPLPPIPPGGSPGTPIPPGGSPGTPIPPSFPRDPIDDFLDPSGGRFRFPGGVNPLISVPGPLGATASLAHVMAPGMAFRPQSLFPGATDFRRASHVERSALVELDQTVPTVAVMVSFGQQTPTGGFVSVPSQYAGGAGTGGVLVAPPDVSETSIESEMACYYALHPNVTGGFGVPSEDRSTLVDGWRIRVQNNNLKFVPVDTDGALRTNVQAEFQSAFHAGLPDGPFLSFNPYGNESLPGGFGVVSADLFAVFGDSLTVGYGRVTEEMTVDRALILKTGDSADVSATGTAKLRYNAALNRWEESRNGSAYGPAFPGGGGGGDGVVEEIVAGAGIAVDATDPARPVVSATCCPPRTDLDYLRAQAAWSTAVHAAALAI